MKIDRTKVENFFRTYTGTYDTTDEKIQLKIQHTYHVAALCEEIARNLKLPSQDVDLAWLCGMLHDVGRFEQLKRFGTFIDADSIDHAAFGAQLLFPQQQEPLIRSFVEEDSEDELIQLAILTHSAYRLPENLDQRTRMFCDLLRDADKIDILRVNIDVPMETIYDCSTRELKTCTLSPQVMEAFQQEHAILRKLKKTPVDHIVSHLALVFELVFPISLAIVQKQGCLQQLMEFSSDNEDTQAQLLVVRKHMEAYMKKAMEQ